MARPILHPSDLSRASTPAFRQALALARGMRRPLLILHVMSPATLLTGDILTTPNGWPQLDAAVEWVARRGTGRLVGRARAAGVRATAMLVRGVPPDEIVRAARLGRAEMIVMGTHGRTGVTRALLGSVATRVVSHAPCPVMTVHGAETRAASSTTRRSTT